MKIKKDRQLKPGDTFNWVITIPGSGSTGGIKKLITVIVSEVYDHHVLCRNIEKSFIKVDITNVDLWLKGIYKKEDRLLNPHKAVEFSAKFLDRSV